MNNKQLLLFIMLAFVISGSVTAQKQLRTYADSIKAYQKNYIWEHEVVEGSDKRFFRFFPADVQYRVRCSFERIVDTTGFLIPTISKQTQHYFYYGKISGQLQGKYFVLFVYQSKMLINHPKYKDYLFLPFTDATTGGESYGSGRYIPLNIPDIVNNSVVIDFNKCYNPYCAYTTGYNCPIPPKENNLTMAVQAGEKAFAKLWKHE